MAKTYLTIIRENYALDVTNTYIEVVLFLLKPVFIDHLIWKGVFKTQNDEMAKRQNDELAK